MKKDKFGNIILNEKDLIDLYLTNTDFSPSKQVLVDSDIIFPEELMIKNPPAFKKAVELDISIEQYDELASSNWYMPEDYKQMDIAKYVLDLCQDETELQRAGKELMMFQERGMFDLLRYLKFLVDLMRANNIIWGVGRGSSVSSFVLYLIGVHKINPIHYQLDIEEFLR
jgi:DNA polymerase III alpha subunit